MTLYRKKMLILAMALIVCAVSILPWSRAAYAAPGAEPTKSSIADKLIIQLGPDWAGVEFELVTDVGKYPGTIVVDATGVLALELSDSSTFTLSCLNSKVAPPAPVAQEPEVQTAKPAETPIYNATDMIPPNEPATADDKEPSQASASEAAPTPDTNETADESEQGIPTLQLVLFIGGAVLCVGGLVVMRVLKKRREYDEEDDE